MSKECCTSRGFTAPIKGVKESKLMVSIAYAERSLDEASSFKRGQVLFKNILKFNKEAPQ